MLRVNNCHSCLYTTVGSNVHHSSSLRCRDAPIPRRLVDSSRIPDHWYPGKGQAPASVCGAGTTSHCRKSSLILSQDMTFLYMQIQSVRFIAKPTATGVGNLLKIIEEFLSSTDPPAALWRRLLGRLSTSWSRLQDMGAMIAAGSAVYQHSLMGVCVMCAFLPVLLWILGRT